VLLFLLVLLPLLPLVVEIRLKLLRLALLVQLQ
jgi:hypothetical protein